MRCLQCHWPIRNLGFKENLLICLDYKDNMDLYYLDL